MMKSFKYRLIPLLLFAANIAGAQLTAISADSGYWRPTFHCDRFNAAECLQFFEADLKAGAAYTMVELTAGMERLFLGMREEGYPLARLDSAIMANEPPHRSPVSKLPGANIIHLYISAGAPVVIGDVKVTGTAGDSAAGRKFAGRLTAAQMERLGDEILKAPLNAGFPFTRVVITPQSIDAEQEKLRVALTVELQRGVFSRLSSVVFPGLRYTRSRLLSLQTRLKRGDLFQERSAERAVERVRRLPFIAEAGPLFIEEESPGWVRVQIPVTERRVNRVSGILAASGRGTKPSGELRLEFGNLMGVGRQLQLEWLGLNPAQQGVRAAYREPWLFGYPWHLRVQLEQWRLDTLGATTEYQLQAEWEPLDRLSVSGALSRQIHGAEVVPSGMGARTNWLEWGIQSDRRNREWNPSQGWKIKILSARGYRRWDAPRMESTIRRETVSAMSAMPLFSKWVLVGNGGGRDIAGSGVQSGELTRIGGAETVRGYAEDYTPGRGAVWGAGELRWRPDPDGYWGVFLDAGRIYRTDQRFPGITRTLTSAGVTFGVTTVVGRLGLDFGIAAGEPLRNARLHLRLESWF